MKWANTSLSVAFLASFPTGLGAANASWRTPRAMESRWFSLIFTEIDLDVVADDIHGEMAGYIASIPSGPSPPHTGMSITFSNIPRSTTDWP